MRRGNAQEAENPKTYLKIPDFISSLPKRPIIGAFTATVFRHVNMWIYRFGEPHGVQTAVFLQENWCLQLL